MIWVYVLKDSITGRLYIGSTQNLDRRLTEHGSKKKTYRLVYKEAKTTYSEAIRREKFFKTGDGRRALKNLLVSV